MEDRLKKLKRVMNQRTFPQLAFTEEHRKRVMKKIGQPVDREEDILFAVMQLLVQAKTGYELAVLLRGRGIRKYENNEGALYTLLHRLEHSGCLTAQWEDDGSGKHYCLNHKGKKLLKKAEQKQTQHRFIFKELLEG